MEGVKGHNFLLIIQNPEALSVTTEMNNSNSPLSSKTSTLKKLATFKKIIVCRNLKLHQDGLNMKHLYAYKVANVTVINSKTKT